MERSSRYTKNCERRCPRFTSSSTNFSSPYQSRSLSSSSSSGMSSKEEGSMNATNSTSRIDQSPVRRYPRSGRKPVPDHIGRPPYAATGMVPMPDMDRIYRHDKESIDRMRQAARLARRALDLACSIAKPGMTTDAIDTVVHNALIEAGAYPSPLNYSGFPKSLCSSVNEVVCHGIPDTRPLQFGDIVSFDVSCFLNGVHGDNCATIIVGDEPDGFESSTAISENEKAWPLADMDWRGVPYKDDLRPDEEHHFQMVRQLSRATRESLYAAIKVCRPGACLTEIGSAIHAVADQYGYSSVRKYMGHGICHEFHCPPFVKHFRNKDTLRLEPGMIFTIEPMLVMGKQDTYEWSDQWTVVTNDESLAAQFEHTILITEDSREILTLP